MQSPFSCTEMVDRKGMPVNRAILITDVPSTPVVGLCMECGTQHRVLAS